MQLCFGYFDQQAHKGVDGPRSGQEGSPSTTVTDSQELGSDVHGGLEMGWYTCCGMVVSTGGHWGGSAACTMNTGKHPPAEHWELGGGWANSAASVASVLVIHIKPLWFWSCITRQVPQSQPIPPQGAIN